MRVLNNIKIDKSSLNREQGTFNFRSTTEYPVLVTRNIDGKNVTYYEILSHDPQDVDLSRVATGAVPLLLGHDDVFKIGKINSVEVVPNSHTVSEVKVADAVKDRVFDYLEGEVLENCSIGAKPTKVVRKFKIDNIPAMVLSWVYVDLSLVSTPADPNSTITRSFEDKYDLSTSIIDDIAVDEQITRSLVEMSIELPEELSNNSDSTVDNEDTSNYNENNISDASATEESDSSKEGTEEASIEVETSTTTYETIETYTTFQTTTTVSKTELSIPYSSISRSQEDLQINKDLNMSIFKIARALEMGTLTDEQKKAVLNKDEGSFVSNEVISRSFRAGTGVNTAGFADEGGNLIPKDMSSDYVKLIYDRYVLAESGVPFIQLNRSCVFPVILSGGTATWIDENSPAIPSDMKTSQKVVKPHYLRLVSDISNAAMKEADDNISVEQVYADDWFSQLNQALQKAYFKGNPALPAETGSPTGIVTTLQATPALAATNVLSFVADVPTFEELNSAFAVLEDAQAPMSVVYINAMMKAKLLSTPVVAGQAVFLATDGGSGRGRVLGRDLFVVPSATMEDDEILIASPSSSFVATFHGGIEVISDSKILATTNQHRFVVRAAYDVFFRYPRHFVFMKKA